VYWQYFGFSNAQPPPMFSFSDRSFPPGGG
jgi:hypothetical protein